MRTIDAPSGTARATAAVPGINVYFQAAQSINIGTTQTRAQYQFGMRSSDLNQLREYAPLMEARMRRIPAILEEALEKLRRS